MSEACQETKKRKRRSDRNHVIYMLQCIETGERYVGVTVAQGQAYLKSVRVRLQKHMSRARIETEKQWRLYEAIRNNPQYQWEASVLEVVRGKAAFQRERVLIKEHGATLNTH